MKLTTLLIASPLLALVSATVLCDKLIGVKANIVVLESSINANVTSMQTLFTAYRNLHAAVDTLDGLNSEITSTTTAINGASATLANLNIQTGCWIGWLVNLEQGLKLVSDDLAQIYQRSALDLMNGNVHSVQGYGNLLKSQADDALGKLSGANAALSTLNQYNDNVNCW